MTVTAVDDVPAEADETIILDLNSDAAYTIGTPNSATITLLANDFVVTSLADSGEGTLRQAITNANNIAGTDTITFTVSGTINLDSGTLSISSSTNIVGSGAITVRRNSGSFRVFFVAFGNTASISGLTIADGLADQAVNPGNPGAAQGGGIFNGGNLTLTNVAFTGNTATSIGGGILNNYSATLTLNGVTFTGNSAADGAALYNRALSPNTVTVTNSTFTNNTASAWGAGVYNYFGSTVSISNSTFSGNTAVSGGAIANNQTMSLTNVTISGNTATQWGGGVFNNAGTLTINNATLAGNSAPDGGGIRNFGAVNATNTLIANSAGGGGNCSGFSGSSSDLSTDATCGGFTQVTTASLNLGSLANNGGSTHTIALGTGSSAIDAGSNGTCAAVDQRGASRPLDGDATGVAVCDVGAYEAPAVAVAVVDVSAFDASADENGDTATFRLTRANGITSNALTVTISLGGTASSGDYTLSVGGTSVTFPANQTQIDVTVTTVDDLAAEPDETVILTVSDGAVYDVGTASATATIARNDLMVTNTNDSGEGSLRQALQNAEAFTGADTISFDPSYFNVPRTITLSSNWTAFARLSITSDVTINGAGGLTVNGNNSLRVFQVNSGVVATLNDMTITGGFHLGALGTGVFNNGNITLNRVTVTGNSSSGGALANNSSGTMTVNDSTISGNTSNSGGGVRVVGGTVTITNTTISSNTATNGGGLYITGGVVTLTNVTVSGNSNHGIVATGGTVTLQNTLSANNTGNNCSGVSGAATNISTDATCSGFTQVTPASLNLGALANNGGSTQTMALGSASTAIDVGDDSACPSFDQRGVERPVDGDGDTLAVCDVGAYEAPLSESTITVTATDASADESGDTAMFQITRGGSSTTNPLIVTFTLSGTASTGDYTLSVGGVPLAGNSATIPANETTVDITVSATNDVSAEPDETLMLTISANAAYEIGTPDSDDVTIAANDTIVTTLADSGEGSLRQAITNANAFSGVETITFNVIGTINLHSALPTLTSMNIYGAGSSFNTIRRSSGSFRLFDIGFGETVNMDGLTLADGNTGADGGAIFNAGTLTLTTITFRDNVSSGMGGAIRNDFSGVLNVSYSNFTGNSGVDGGAIYNRALAPNSVTVSNTTFTDNTASGWGGAIYNYFGSTVVVSSSTFSGNTAVSGGAIANNEIMTLTNVTISGNTATQWGGGIHNNAGTLTLTNATLVDNSAPDGGGILTFGTVIPYNTLIASSTGGNCSGVGGTADNISTDATCSGFASVSAASLNLGTLNGNGGFTETIALGAGSTAIDAGSDATCAAVDQRGVGRALDGNADSTATCDVGAFEADAVSLAVITINTQDGSADESGETGAYRLTRTSGVTANALTVNFSLSGSAFAGDYTLSVGGVDLIGNSVTFAANQTEIVITVTAVDDAAAEADETTTLTISSHPTYFVTIPADASVTIARNDVGVTTTTDGGEGSLRQAVENANIFGTTAEIIIPTGTYPVGSPLTIASNLTLTGAGTGATTISGAGQRVFSVVGGAILFRGLTITGGGIEISAGIVTIGNDPVIITGNNTSVCGGGLQITGGTVTLTAGSQINGNSTTNNGGGICVFGGSLIVTGSGTQVNGNTATGNGGGIYVSGGSVTVQSGASVSGNSAAVGGGIYQANAGEPPSSLSITDAFVQQNVGGALRFGDAGTRSVTNTCIVLNGDTAVTFAGGTGVIATGNWWGSAAGPYSGLSMPAPNDGNTVGSYGDSVSQSSDPAVFDYSGYQLVSPSGCYACTVPSMMSGQDRNNRICPLVP